MVPCILCGRGIDAREARFGRCPTCTTRLMDTVTEATPFYGMIEGVRHHLTARQADRRGR